MALGWNGDALAAAAHKPVSYVVAKEGGEFWVDSYVIPVGAKNTDAAHAWIDYVYDPKHNAVETAFTYYGSPLKRALLKGKLDPKILGNVAVFPATEHARAPRAEQRHRQGDAAEEQDLDRVQERVAPPVPAGRGRRGGAAAPATRVGSRFRRWAGTPRSSSSRSGSSSRTASLRCRASPTSPSPGTSTTTARSGIPSTARSSAARSGSPSSAR